MLTDNLLSSPHADAMAAAESSIAHLVASQEVLAWIARRTIGGTAQLDDSLDAKRVIERAIEIDAEEPGSPLTESQWDFGLDMLARVVAPPEGNGLALRQARIVAALSRALAELMAEAKATAF